MSDQAVFVVHETLEGELLRHWHFARRTLGGNYITACGIHGMRHPPGLVQRTQPSGFDPCGSCFSRKGGINKWAREHGLELPKHTKPKKQKKARSENTDTEYFQEII